MLHPRRGCVKLSVTAYVYRSDAGLFSIELQADARWHVMWKNQDLGSCHSAESALRDLVSGHTQWPACGNPSELGLSDQLRLGTLCAARSIASIHSRDDRLVVREVPWCACSAAARPGSHIAHYWAMDMRKPASEGKPADLSPDSELLWRALMSAFEDASEEVLARLHAHQTQGTQQALDDLARAQRRRSTALTDMLVFLDDLDQPSKW